MNWKGLLIVIIGWIVFGGGAYNWRWVMQRRNARWLVAAVGARGARITYMVIGAFMIGLGVLIVAGVVPLG